jgi:hypothetical protein
MALAGAMALAGFVTANEARAQEGSGVLDTRHHSYASPQHFAMELRVAPYRPQIDEEPGLTTAPYNKVFGNAYRIEVALELDWQVLRIPHVGTIGPGLGVGYTTMSSKAKIVSTGKDSDETTSLSIYPMYGVFVFRADVFQREAKIPLVPYVKAGIGLAFYRASNDKGTSVSTSKPDEPGKGHTFGTHLAVGLALHLNVFDQVAARNLDESVGINNTYLFGEYMMSDLKGISQDAPMYVGTRTLLGGLAFEF